MKRATTDRGEIIHAAGLRHLSPAVDAHGDPAFSSAPGDGLTRCGWERFFKALQARRLALACDPEDPSATRLVRAAGAGQERSAGTARLAGALAHSRRFWEALVGK